ncbi:MAG: type VI secretion system tube protein Hcp [Methylococcales bacterium]
MSTDMFIKIGDIKGESKDSKHKDEIEMLSWGWGFSNMGTAHSGGGSGGGKVQVHDIHFSKHTDCSTHALIASCCKGTHHKEATLHVRKAGDKPLEYIIIKMKEVFITSVTMDGHGSSGEVPMESVTLKFAEFEYAYQPQKTDGSADGGKKEFKFSIEEHVVR